VLVPGTPECGHCFYCAEGRPDQCSELFDAKAYFHVAFRQDGAPVSAAGNVGGYAEMMNVTANQAPATATARRRASRWDAGSLRASGRSSTWPRSGRAGRSRPLQAPRAVDDPGRGWPGWERIIAVEPTAAARDGGRLGATDLADPADGDPVEQVRALTGGRGADYVRPRDDRRAGAGVDHRAPRRDDRPHRPSARARPSPTRVRSSRSRPACSAARTASGCAATRRFRGCPGRPPDAEPIITTRYPLDGINGPLRPQARTRPHRRHRPERIGSDAHLPAAPGAAPERRARTGRWRVPRLRGRRSPPTASPARAACGTSSCQEA
jgi:S-(hydroxymethyl)glutathione dehydrogenase/alcohol dehydrogenase